MELLIPKSLSKILMDIGGIGGTNAYLVGGSVRDMLLKRPTIDIDIVVEGDAIKVADQLKTLWNGSIQIHHQFGTATVKTTHPTYRNIDFVSARRETYKLPGTLPNVELGTLDDDLMRRDFSINALAMCLDSERFGKVIDRTGGIEDLEKGTVRVLHEKSFIDDPTRIFRACRYAGRYGFNIYENDISLIEEALPHIAEVSGERIRNEMIKVFLEDKELIIIRALDKLGVFKTLFRGWKNSPNFSSANEIKLNAIVWSIEHLEDEGFNLNHINWIALFGFCSFQGMQPFQIEAISFRLVLDYELHRICKINHKTKHESDETEVRNVFDKSEIELSENTLIDFFNGKWCIVDSENEKTFIYDGVNIFCVNTPLTTYRKLSDILLNITDNTANSDIYKLLTPFPLETLILAYQDPSISDVNRMAIGHFLLVLRKVSPIITGDDLIKWGEKPGKSFKTLLWDLFAAQLDGMVNSKSDAYMLYQEFQS